jgi:hypothetical protein
MVYTVKKRWFYVLVAPFLNYLDNFQSQITTFKCLVSRIKVSHRHKTCVLVTCFEESHLKNDASETQKQLFLRLVFTTCSMPNCISNQLG